MIRFSGFSKVFGAHRAVDNLTLTIEKGETVALLGPNGSGKTTSLKAAAGLVRPTCGTVRIGESGFVATDPRARWDISYLPQKVVFPEGLAGREVVEFYRRLRGADALRTNEVLKLANLNGAASRAVGTYSGGMVQRLGLAVATAADAPVLLFDEPTSSLDADGIGVFWDLVSQQKRGGKTVVFASHQLGDVERLADRVVILVNGRMVASLTVAELSARLANSGLLKIRVDICPPSLLEKLRSVAAGIEYRDGHVHVPGSPQCRSEAIVAINSEGVEIRGLSAEEGRLDRLYLELEKGAP